MSDYIFEIANLDDSQHRQVVIDLLDAYMRDGMGINAPMREELKEPALQGLQFHKESFVLMVKNENSYLGLATCFYGFSTFNAQPLINIHDLIVLPAFRSQGVGRALLREIESIARKKNCCKITLEVRIDNQPAKALYQKEGFADGDPPMHFWSKWLG
ncbi:MAG: GNAT family N-acetyltransferase [Cyclobacteriaceae bacterium]